MTEARDWKVVMDRRLMHSDVESWSTGMLWNEASATPSPPSRPTFERWLATTEASGRLRKVRKGLYLNAAANRNVSPAAAAGWIRQGAIPSLAWVLEQDWILNNFGNIITCVVPLVPGLGVPNLSAVRTPLGEFHFRALPARLYELNALQVSDWRDSRYFHPRATPEKALCDWLHFAASPRSPMSWPPLDLELKLLNGARLRRVARAMGIQAHLASWLASKNAYDDDPDVMENASSRLKAAP